MREVGQNAGDRVYGVTSYVGFLFRCYSAPKTSEPRAAKWISETLGEIEIERLKESRTPELIGSRKTFAMEIATKPLIMASEIAGLEPLHGYVKQENRVVPVRFAFVPKRSLQPEFVERKMTIPEPRLVQLEAMPEVKAGAIPMLRTIHPEALQQTVSPAPQSGAAAPALVPAPELSLFSEAAVLEPTQPKPRRSAFKKKEGTARQWKPTD